jgi:hypothetical protein
MEPDIQKPECKTSTWLFNPFHYLAGEKALLLGLAFILLAGSIASTGKVHLDGVLDFHVGSQQDFPFWLYLAEGLIDWCVLAVFLFFAGKLLSKSRIRALDVLGTQALARWPSLLTVLIGLVPAFQRQSLRMIPGMQVDTPAGQADMIIWIAGLVASILMIIWMVALMYRAYIVSCNLKGAKAVLSFILALLAAEAVSKLIIMRMFRIIGLS